MAFVMSAVISGGGAALGAIGNVIGGVVQGNAARDSSKMQADAASHASDLQYQMFQKQQEQQQNIYNQQRADAEPWRQAGVTALSQMASPDFQKNFSMSDYQQDPGYQFRMQEGQNALQASAAARGGLLNGNTLKAITNYGQNAASNEYQNAYNRFNSDRDRRYNRLSSLAGIGQTATGQMGNYGGQFGSQMGQASQNYANQVGSNMMGAANAQGAAGIAGANAVGGAIGGIGNTLSGLGSNWMTYSMMNRMAPGGGGAPAGGGGSSGGSMGGFDYSQSPSSFFGLGG